MNWEELSVAPAGTYHTRGGAPAYSKRFDRVLKFHPPGLAPVADSSGAYHIHPNGKEAYPRRFVATFGFYEGRSAVETADGWCHVDPEGSPLYPEHYEWCGNYQGGRSVVRERQRRYFHLDECGAPAYGERYRYAGDFRDGIACVQDERGLHAHIDRDGGLIHDRWYLDLDVFHKGHARARDGDGWFHIDNRGEAVYDRRFAMVEPFYNGQARVETEDGSLVVIDLAGETVIQLRAAGRSYLEYGSLRIPARPREHYADRDTTPEGVPLAINLTIPTSTLQGLRLVPRDVPVALLVRHAHRPPIPEGTYGNEIGLVPEGVELARQFGRHCRRLEAGRVASSPMSRCMDTASAIAHGAGWDVAIEEDTRLGVPGPFVTDPRIAGPHFLARGPRAVATEQLTDGGAPGMRSTREGATLLIRAMLEPAAVAGLAVFVTHDSILMALVGWLWGLESIPARWPRFLEGLFLWRRGTNLQCRWRGEQRAIAWAV